MKKTSTGCNQIPETTSKNEQTKKNTSREKTNNFLQAG